jgi:type I restriction enzyme S subunit
MKSGWAAKPLGEVCSFLNRGISPKYLDSGGICVLNQRCVRDHRVSFEPARRHDARAKKVGAERHVQAGDVLVNSTGTGTLGRVAQLRDEPPEPTTVDSHVTIVRPVPAKFYPEFFGYMLTVIEDAIKEAGEGCGGQTELARSVLAEKFSVHYPESLSEQKRIVGILDEAFEDIATAKANAETNLRNVRALFESHLQAVFSKSGDGWTEKTLGDVCLQITDGKHGDCDDQDDSGFYFLSAKDIRSGTLNWEGARQIKKRDFEETHRRTNLEAGDILITNSGTIGRMAIAPSDSRTQRTTFQKSVAILKPLKTEIDGKFAFYCLSSGLTRFENLSAGAAQKNLLLRDLRTYRFALPQSLDQQRKVARELDSLSLESQRLESIYRQKLAAFEELKKSLLHQAFEGAL